MAATHLIRLGNASAYAKFRLSYGVLNLSLTVLACLLVGWTPALVASASLVFLGMALVAVYPHRKRMLSALRQPEPIRWRQMASYSRQFLKASLGNFTAGIAFQISAFFVPMAGSYSNAWASVLRLTGGFATISQNVIAPSFEMAFSDAVRSKNRNRVKKEVARAALFGLCISVPFAIAAVATAVLTVGFDPASDRAGHVFLIAATMYAFAVLTPAIALKYLVLLGAQKSYIGWAVLKACSMVGVVLFLEGLPLVVGFAAVEFLFAARGMNNYCYV